MKEQCYEVRPVGVIEAGTEGFLIRVEKSFRPALEGLGDFSHITVLWWGHLVDDEEYRTIRIAEKPYVKGPLRLGIFATRSPLRPNPLEISTVAVLEVEATEGIIRLPWIDAEDGTPVLDIKPYHPCEDRVKQARVPAWCSHWPVWMEDSEHFNWEEEFSFRE